MRKLAVILLFLCITPAYGSPGVDSPGLGRVGPQTFVRPAGRSGEAIGTLAPTNQFDQFVRYSAEKRYFEAMASNTAYFRDVFTGGETFHASPNDGDSFSARMYGPDGSLVSTWYPIVFYSSYNGQQNCWVGSLSGTICGTTSIYITWFIQSQCFTDGTYQMDFLYNGQPFSSGSFDLLPEIPPDSLPTDLSIYNQGMYDGSDPTRDHYDKRCYVTDPDDRHNCDDRAGEKLIFIKKLGCYLSAAALVTTYHGVALTPPELNTILNASENPNGYNNGCVDPEVVAKVATDRGVPMSFIGREGTSTLMHNICAYGPQLMGVNCDSGVPGHWVLAIGIDRGTNSYKIVNPSGGRVTTLYDRYHTFCATRVFSGPEYVVTIKSRIVATFHSPVELLLTDPMGRRLGRDPVTGQLYEEIPHAYYNDVGLDDDETGDREIDPPKELYLPRPDSGDYSLIVLGTGDGTYTADFEAADVNGTESTSQIQNVPISTGEIQNLSFHYDSTAGSTTTLQLAGGYDGGGQRPRDVNKFLSYGNPSESQTQLAAGTQTFPLLIFYGPETDPSTFLAELDRNDVTALFNPQPGTSEIVELPLGSGRNVLKVSIDGQLPNRTATDTDRLVFMVP